jgi:hypothetical protein
MTSILLLSACKEKGDTGESFEAGFGACIFDYTGDEDFSACVQGTIEAESDCSGDDSVSATLKMGDSCDEHGFPTDCSNFAPGTWTETSEDCDALISTL